MEKVGTLKPVFFNAIKSHSNLTFFLSQKMSKKMADTEGPFFQQFAVTVLEEMIEKSHTKMRPLGFKKWPIGHRVEIDNGFAIKFAHVRKVKLQ